MKNYTFLINIFCPSSKIVAISLCFFGLTSYLKAQSTYFGSQNIITTGANGAQTVFAADLDGDTYMDVLVASATDDKVAWQKNDGNGNFGPRQYISIGNTPTYASATDLDGDGDMDVLYSLLGRKLIWQENDGVGNFGPKQVITSSASILTSVYTIDLDNDGDIDVLSSSRYSNKIAWYENDGSGNFGPQLIISNLAIDAIAVYAADLDNDGDIDVFSTSQAIDKLVWYENDGTENFSSQYTISNLNLQSISAADLDGDGDMDVIASSVDLQATNKIVWFENDGNGNFSSEQALSYNVAEGVRHIHLSDLDGDGDMDVLSASFSIIISETVNDRIAWYENDGSGNFGPQQTISTSITYPLYVYSSDLDGDGDLDVLSASHWDDKIAWYENDVPTSYVDASATGSESGNDWENAFTDLQDALSKGENTTIYLAEGTYFPSQSMDRNSSFAFPSGTTLFGAYPSGGGERNPELYESILSGNIDLGSINGDTYHVVKLKDVENVILDAVTIRDGNANNPNSFGQARGGGLYIINSDIELKDVNVKWNRSIYGAGLFASKSNIIITTSEFKNNRSEYGSALYYSNETEITLLQSKFINNISYTRCALESNNATQTIIQNCLIANNVSNNANAIGFIANNRNSSVQIFNSTILGGNSDKNIITYQVGNNDQLDVTINNSIIAHQNPSFNKNMIAYNNNILNLNHNNCYFQGSSVIGNGTNTLFSDIDGNLLLNNDYSVNECSPVVNNGDDALTIDSVDVLGNPRYYNQVDIGAYEAQISCIVPRLAPIDHKNTFTISPNPSLGNIKIQTLIENPKINILDVLGQTLLITRKKDIDLSHLPEGIYIVYLEHNGKFIGTKKIIKK